jgi:LEA14-like dessication related protein
MSGRLRSIVLGVAIALSAGACATSKPYVSVVGTGQSPGDLDRNLVVVVEIHNPTTTPLRLHTLEYTLARHGASTRTRGKVILRDTVAPGHTSTVDIAVPLSAGSEPAAGYDLQGRLRGSAGDVELNWKIAALAQASGAQAQ